jgi:hypothetical protein
MFIYHREGICGLYIDRLDRFWFKNSPIDIILVRFVVLTILRNSPFEYVCIQDPQDPPNILIGIEGHFSTFHHKQGTTEVQSSVMPNYQLVV